MATLSFCQTCTRDSSRVTLNHYVCTYAGDCTRAFTPSANKIRILLQTRPSNFGMYLKFRVYDNPVLLKGNPHFYSSVVVIS